MQVRPNSARRWIPLVAVVAVLAATMLGGQRPASAQEEPPIAASDQTETRLRLNYLMADWRKVSEEVAEGFGLELVADKFPSGRYTRRDRFEYTQQEALRILNEELDQRGFRYVTKGNFLILLERSADRPRYLPREYGTTPKPASQTDNGTPSEPAPQNRRGGDVVQVDHEADAEPSPQADAERTAPQQPSTLIQPQQRPARDIARDIYRVFQKRGEILPDGAHGLPAFRVRMTRTPAQPAFGDPTVAIDTEHDRIVVNADAEIGDELVTLAQFFDAKPDDLTRRKALTATPKATAAVRSLTAEQRKLAMLVAQNQPAANGNDQNAPGQPAADPAGADPDQPREDGIRAVVPAEEGELAGLNSALKGEVRINSLDDLGVIIVEGSEEDVEAVVRLIQRLEQFSEVTTPEIHVRLLREIDARSMAQLITSIYSRLTEFPGAGRAARQNVSVVPLDSPNAIVILAPAGDLESILELVDQLDRPTDPSDEVQIFRLKSATAIQAQELVEAFFEERGEFAAEIKVLADVRTNSLVVRARPRELSQLAELIRRIDVNSTAALSQMKIFPLQHAIADELAEVINTTLTSLNSPQGAGNEGFGQIAGVQGEAAEALREARSTALQFLTSEAGIERMVRSGILSDIRVNADLRTNSLMVTAPRESMEMMAELIKALDRPSSTVAEIKVFTLENADAALMADQLEELFAQATVGDSDRPQGIDIAGSQSDPSTLLVPLRFSVDTRTNSLVAIGSADALLVVEGLLRRLDSSDVRERQNTVVRLKNSPAEAVAGAINEFLQSQRDLQQTDPDLISSVERLEREIIVVPEPVSNSLLVSATPRYFDEITDLVQRLDEAPAQVIIQALLVEVELDNTDEFGVELGFQDPVFFARSLIDDIQTISETTTSPNGVQTTTQRIISQAGTPGFNFNNQPLGNNIASNPSSVGSQGLSNFSLGRTNNDLGFGGLVLSAGSESVSVLIRALAAQRKIHILSRPQIRTLDNQLAQIQVGQQVPIVDGVNVTATGVTNPLIRQDQAGIILTVTPRISPDGQIVMEVIAEKSAFTGAGVPIFTDANTGNVIESPIKDLTNARTTVSVPNGQTVVIGGMITNSDDTVERKVPFLGDVPLLGSLFRYDSVNKRRTELIMFLTPRVIANDIDSEIIKDVEMGRMHFMLEKAEEIHGPLYGVPPEGADGAGRPLMLPQEPAELDELPNKPLPPVPAVPPADGEAAEFQLEDGVPTSRMAPPEGKVIPRPEPAPFRRPSVLAKDPREVNRRRAAAGDDDFGLTIEAPADKLIPAGGELPDEDSPGKAVLRPIPLDDDPLPNDIFPDDQAMNRQER